VTATTAGSWGASPKFSAPRIAAIDILRGFVMILMTIDHANEKLNAAPVITDSAFFFKQGDPLPVAGFLTRWMTHLCAPTFVALAGTALAISTEARRARGASERSLDMHIATRGVIIFLFEALWMSWVMQEGVGKFLFQVLYAISMSLLCMTLLRRLRDNVLLAFGIVVLLGLEPLLGLFSMWGVAERLPVGLIFAGGLFFDGRLVIAYPMLPWLAIMSLGWVFGRRLVAWRLEGRDEVAVASRVVAMAGVLSLGLFLVLRGINGPGNMMLLRATQPGVDGTIVQWLHVSKYPPSVTFATLELGISALLLAGLLRLKKPATLRLFEPMRLLGSTALFYYLLHIHALMLVAKIFHVDHKLGLAAAWIGGALTLALIYPACVWYRGYKSRHPRGWAQWI
jgi:uncharacterized membrane protein